jgi:hypothetical protein
MAMTSLTSVGSDVDSPEPTHRPSPAMKPKYLKYKTRIWAMMLKNFRISRPDGGLDPHVGQGYWEGDGETFLRTQ